MSSLFKLKIFLFNTKQMLSSVGRTEFFFLRSCENFKNFFLAHCLDYLRDLPAKYQVARSHSLEDFVINKSEVYFSFID